MDNLYRKKIDKILFETNYSDTLFNAKAKPYIKDKQRFEHALKMLQHPHGKLIYEIGPYPGSGAYYFGEDNFILGIGKGNNVFDEQFRACGHEIYSMDFESEEIPDDMINKADIVVAMEVIEHIRQPLQFLGKIMKLVKPGGVIYITTNNTSYIGYIGKLIIGNSPLDAIKTENTFYPGHCRYYNESELVEIFKDNGFSISVSRKINFLPHYSLYNNKFFGFFKNSLIKLIPKRYSTHIEILVIKNL